MSQRKGIMPTAALTIEQEWLDLIKDMAKEEETTIAHLLRKIVKKQLRIDKKEEIMKRNLI